MLIEVLGGALGGAATTIIGSHWISRPKPSLHHFEISLECPQLPNAIQAEVIAQMLYRKGGIDFCEPPSDIIDVFQRHDYLDPIDEVYRHYLNYTNELFSYRNENAMLKAQLSEMNAKIDNALTLFGTAGRFKDAMEILSSTDTRWWSPLFGEFRRANFTIDDISDKELEEAEAKHLAVVKRYQPDPNRDHIQIHAINLGRRNLSFPVGATANERETLFAKKICKIFETEHDAGMKKILNFLREYQWVLPIFDKAEELLDREIRKYSRMIFRGGIANNGRTAFALTGKGKIQIHAAGESFIVNGAAQTCKNDIECDISLVDETKIRVRDAISVDAGKIEPITLVSDLMLHQMPEEIEVKQLYGTNVTATLYLQSSLGSDVTCQFEFK